MLITVNGTDYELSTKLGTGKKIEEKFKVPLVQLFGKLGDALSSELTDIIAIAAGKAGDSGFMREIDDNWDYSDLYNTVQELVLRFQFSGSPADIERKLVKYPGNVELKNAIRELLGVPIPKPALPESTGLN